MPGAKLFELRLQVPGLHASELWTSDNGIALSVCTMTGRTDLVAERLARCVDRCILLGRYSTNPETKEKRADSLNIQMSHC
jgi:hypothetical protein